VTEKYLKKNSDTCNECGFLKIDYFVAGGRGFDRCDDLRRDDEGRNSDGQPLQAKKQKGSERRAIIKVVSEVLIQFSSGLRWFG
jgi:hypothetical protein